MKRECTRGNEDGHHSGVPVYVILGPLFVIAVFFLMNGYLGSGRPARICRFSRPEIYAASVITRSQFRFGLMRSTPGVPSGIPEVLKSDGNVPRLVEVRAVLMEKRTM